MFISEGGLSFFPCLDLMVEGRPSAGKGVKKGFIPLLSLRNALAGGPSAVSCVPKERLGHFVVYLKVSSEGAFSSANFLRAVSV